MSAEVKPYVVSADLHGLLGAWGRAVSYNVPAQSYIVSISEDLRSALESAFPDNPIDIVPEKEIKNGLVQLVRDFRLPVVSMDRAYVDKTIPYLLGFIDVTRPVDGSFNKLDLMPREGFPPLDKQIQKIASRQQCGVALVDDVVFSGGDLVGKDGILQKMNRAGLPVRVIITGIGIGEGVKRIRDFGTDIVCVREYGNVIDEICKRDFFAGVPMSGRMLVEKNGQIWSAPYFRPFGDPAQWASIPNDKISDFSEYCLLQSIKLWSEIERLSQACILTEATPRQIREFRRGVSIVKALKEQLDSRAYLG